jgi:sortase A
MKRPVASVVPVLLVVVAAAEVARGLWVPAKAELAQILIHRAWHEIRQGTKEARPWHWADTRPVARLRMPSLDADFIVLAGASGSTMAFGPGHLHGTAAPGGEGTCVIAGHRDTHFAVLQHLAAGQSVSLEDRFGRIHEYVVHDAFVVHENEVSELCLGGTGGLVLMTCWPFDEMRSGGEWRYLVQAKPADVPLRRNGSPDAFQPAVDHL